MCIYIYVYVPTCIYMYIYKCVYILMRGRGQARPRVLEREGHARRLLVDNRFIDCIRRYVRVYNSTSRYIRL